MKRKIDNRGAAMVTVIVVTTFITIIATTMLYITARNFITKQVDYNNTVSFYQAEEALDTLKALMVQDLNDAYMYAYADSMANYLDYGSDIKNYYADSFTGRLQSYWDKRGEGLDKSDASTYYLKCIKKYMTTKLVDEETDDEKKAKNQKLIDCITGVKGFTVPPANDKFVIAGVTAEYTSDNGYSTYIMVDIGLELPNVEFNKDDTDVSAINVTDCVKYMNWQRD